MTCSVVEPDGGTMSNSGDKRKAAAKCTACDEIYPVKIWSDGTIHPLGSDDVCDCERATLRILGDDVVDERGP